MTTKTSKLTVKNLGKRYKTTPKKKVSIASMNRAIREEQKRLAERNR